MNDERLTASASAAKVSTAAAATPAAKVTPAATTAPTACNKGRDQALLYQNQLLGRMLHPTTTQHGPQQNTPTQKSEFVDPSAKQISAASETTCNNHVCRQAHRASHLLL